MRGTVSSLVAKMGTRWRRNIMLCLSIALWFATSEEFQESSEGLSFTDWTRILATEQEGEEIHKEGAHRVAREKLHQWLTPTDKWHFVIGYRDTLAARKLPKIHHHLPQRNSSLHFVLTFISTASAEAIRKRRLLVEPLLPYLKIEDLTLGKLIREEEDRTHEAVFSLKAILARDALTPREVTHLAHQWESAISQNPSLSTHTLRYSHTEGQTGLHEDGAQSAIECVVSIAAIVCSGIPKSALRDAGHFMAAHAVVQLVELNPRYEVFNKWAKFVTQSVSGKRLPIFRRGLRGQGEVIACADTGIDTDNCFFRDRFVVEEDELMHCFFRDRCSAVPFNAVNLQARKVVQYVVSWGDKTDFGSGHGTHVAGSIAGDTEQGSNPFAGMAPAAKLAFFDLGSNSSNLNAPIELGKGVFEYGYMAGARIFSNSWGVLRQGYSSNSHEVDSFSYLNEEVLIIFAVGNQGTLGKGTIASPASSKNCLAVGASFNAAASLTSEGEDYSRNLMKPSMVAPFSSAGPTIDGRIKPDVLAPGMVVWSSVPDFGQGPKEQNCQVGPKQGTSSSTPVVAGLASLARQYFREGYYPSGKRNPKDGFIPSGALLKAVMIHSAVPERRYINSSGMTDLQLAPDFVEGFGLVVLEKVLVFANPRSRHQPSSLIVLSGRRDGAVAKHRSLHTVTLRVTSSKEPLRMTMVWMDPPAAPSSLHPMVNDLNLKLHGPGNQTFFPNGMNKEDSINNVEVIEVMKPKKGPWRVTVEGARVINDMQPYALVLTGGFRRVKGAAPYIHHDFTTDSDISAADRKGFRNWIDSYCLCVCSTLFLFPRLEI